MFRNQAAIGLYNNDTQLGAIVLPRQLHSYVPISELEPRPLSSDGLAYEYS